MTKNTFKLIAEIIKLSTSKNWLEAKEEWEIDNIYYSKEKQICLCGHSPIKEIVIIKNLTNSNITKIGNCCINKIFEINSYNKFFKALKEKRINKLIIDTSFNKKIINDWEKQFLYSTWRKKNLSPKQVLIFNKIHQNIFDNLTKKDGEKYS